MSFTVSSRVQHTMFLALLLIPFLAFSAVAEFQDSPMLSVKGTQVYLYSSRRKRSEVIAKLQQGEKLTPLANVPGEGESWYLVKTQKGIHGWVISSDVQGVDELKKIFEESLPEPSLVVPPTAPFTPSNPILENAITVPIEMSGSIVIIPVILNRSLKTYMIMDTGSSLTTVTPRIAKKLGLKSLSTVSVMTANGTIMVPLARLGSLKIGNAEVHSLMATVQTFPLGLGPRISGLLGLNFLSRFHTSIDPRRQLLTLAPR